MPPRYLRRSSPTRLKKCAEFPIEVCDKEKADGCCGVLPCKLCLTWETYANGISYGSAEFGSASWTGTAGGIAFTAYWERSYNSGECEFVVIFGGEEVYRSDCYGGASCRDPSGSVETEVNYEAGTLTWSVYEPRELELIDDPDTGCRTHFCGSCHCSCECLCVTITETDGTVTTGEICDVAYPCDAPTWAGTVGTFELSIVLGRDSYGDCIVTPTVNGEEGESVAAPGCGTMAATITLYDGTMIAISCKQCTCTPSGEVCCPERCNPMNYETCANPLPLTLTCTLTVSTAKLDPITGVPSGCFTCTGTLYLSPIGVWIGVVEGTCSGWCGGSTRVFQYLCTVECGVNPDGSITWFIRIADNEGGDSSRLCVAPFSDPPVWAAFESTCDPIMLTGQSTSFLCSDLACVIPILDIDEFFGDIIFDALVTEDP